MLSPAKIDELIAACKEYLDNHPGLIYFGAGRLNPDLARPVNDRAFHVSLHTVFADRAAHDAYQVEPRHLKFIEQNKPNWKTVSSLRFRFGVRTLESYDSVESLR